MSTSRKQVAFLFGEGANASAAVLGGKGAGLCELVKFGLPVPPGFTVTTSVARAYAQHRTLPVRLFGQLERNVRQLERLTGKRFGDQNDPLLVSVRSGAAVSMPGMMDTVLNLGVNRGVVAGLARRSNDRFAYDCYRRFLTMFGNVVMGVDRHLFEQVLTEIKLSRKVEFDYQLSGPDLREVCAAYETVIERACGSAIPDDPYQQLHRAVVAVLRSWDSERAVAYRKAHKIANLGTAVNVQAMVYGNRDEQSATGVVFSSNVSTGETGMWGEWLVNAQGEDVVAGIRTPEPVGTMKDWNLRVYTELDATVKRLAEERKQVVDVEFTVESGKLYILQVRRAKLAPVAAATVCVHGVWEKKITREQAVASITGDQLTALQARGFDTLELTLWGPQRLMTSGVSASMGVAVGKVALTSEEAVRLAARGETVILVRPDTSPDDLPGMLAAAATLTQTGGTTSHAAVVARGLGKPCIVGCSNLAVVAGQTISVDANTGKVYDGKFSLAESSKKKEVSLFLRWVAAEQAKLWPKPRLDFDLMDQQVDCTTLIADFYLSDAMAEAAKGTMVERDAIALRIKVHTRVAERLATYLTLACGGEIRHAYDYWTGCSEAMRTLRGDFGVLMDRNDRFEAQKSSVAKLRQAEVAEQLRFLELVTEVFRKGSWSPAYGGAKWGAISYAAFGFLNGQLSHSVFADHAFDLQHNNGTVFGKNQMIRISYRTNVQQLLDVKKHAKGVADLRRELSDASAVLGADVEALYRRGEQLKLWKS